MGGENHLFISNPVSFPSIFIVLVQLHISFLDSFITSSQAL